MPGESPCARPPGLGYPVLMSDRDASAPVVDWVGQWIWYGEDPAPYNCHLYFRRDFDLAHAPRAARLHVTATDRYCLFVNGEYLGRGPERCDARFQSFDTYDLAGRLRAGPNSIAAHAYFYGCPTHFAKDGRAGFLAQLEEGTAGGWRPVVATDTSWRVLPARGWRKEARPTGILVGITEVFDARLDPADWMRLSCDASGWPQAVLVPLPSGQWCSRPFPRTIPFLAEEEALPKEVLAAGEVLALDDSRIAADIAELLAREIPEPLRHARFAHGMCLLNPKAAAAGDVVASAATSNHDVASDLFDGIRDPFVLLDFGRQVNAFPRLTVEGEDGSIVDVAYGEQLVGGRIAPLIGSTRAADRYILREGLQTIEAFEYKSFRYLQLTVRTSGAPLLLHRVAATTLRYPATVRGAFECSEETLTRLWKACVATTDLCTDDAFMDSPFREKANWIGDGSHALLGAFAAWGDVAVIRRYFDLVRQGSLGDGMLRMHYPGSDAADPRTHIVAMIPQHALVWAMRVAEHYRLFGDPTLLRSLLPTLRDLDGWCDRHRNGDGLLDRLPYFCWLDWTPTDIRGINFGTNAFALRLLDDLVFIEDALGNTAQSACWKRKAVALREALRERFWDERRGLYLDSLYRRELTGVASELGNGLALLFGIATPERTERIAAALLARDSGLAPCTPLFFHYVPQGLFSAGQHQRGLALMTRRFAPMMRASQTLWEGWNRHAMLPQITEATPDVPAVLPEGRWDRVIPRFRPCADLPGALWGPGLGAAAPDRRPGHTAQRSRLRWMHPQPADRAARARRRNLPIISRGHHDRVGEGRKRHADPRLPAAGHGRGAAAGWPRADRVPGRGAQGDRGAHCLSGTAPRPRSVSRRPAPA